MDWYSVNATRREAEIAPPPSLPDLDPANYRPDPGLAAAVNVSILLAQPLLVTGEPGTGKTMLASSVAWQLGLPVPLAFETKSTSVARDLFYSYDAIGRFQASQLETATDPARFITFNALGLAILRANKPGSVPEITLPGHLRAERSVVLVDEIDKAPRDFPNDVLTELAGMQFRIPELRYKLIDAPPELRPIVIITSNSEKNLPDAFLRRCIYYHIPFPSASQLMEIILARIAGLSDTTQQRWVREALDLFFRLREEQALLKKPSTAELLGWLLILRRLGVSSNMSLRNRREEVIDTLGVLIKNATDMHVARNLATTWLSEP